VDEVRIGRGDEESVQVYCEPGDLAWTGGCHTSDADVLLRTCRPLEQGGQPTGWGTGGVHTGDDPNLETIYVYLWCLDRTP